MRTLNVVELYAGIGRCSAPFREWRKARIGLLADWNPHARDTYQLNHPKTPYLVADLSDSSVHDLERAAGGKIDIVLGCPPCQGFSDSGRRDPDDPRNSHVLSFARLAAGARPLAIAMENVPMTAISPQFRAATALLENAGYRWTAAILNAAQYGSAQTRLRLVMVALRCDIEGTLQLPAPTHSPIGTYFDYRSRKLKRYEGADDDLMGVTSTSRRAETALTPRFGKASEIQPTPTFSDATAGLPAIGSAEARRLCHETWGHSTRMLQRMRDVPEGGQLETLRDYYASAYARLHRRGLARTLTTYFPNAGSGRFWHPTENRSLTVREAARLQGVPDSFRFMGGPTKANATLLGNTLDAHLAAATFRSVRAALA